MSSNEIFPSLLWDGAGYDPKELSQEIKDRVGEDNSTYPVLRKMAQHAETDDINGKSNKLEVLHWFSGRFPKGEVDEHIDRAMEELDDE